MKISTNYLFDQATQQMGTAQATLSKTQAQIAAAKQVLSPSDAPDQAAAIQRLKSVIGRQDSHTRALNTIETRLKAEDTTLRSAGDLLIRVKEISLQAANATLNPSDRQALGAELKGLRDQLLSLANTQDSNGNYLFAGSRLRQPAFAEDASGHPVYQGDQTRMNVVVGEQRSIQVNRTGSDAFVRVVRPYAGITAATTQGTASVTESSAVTFGTALTAGQTVTIGGLTYTSTGDTSTAELAAAFASLANGATTGAATATGSYSGALTGFATGAASGATVTATSLTTGNVTDLQTDGSASGIGFFQVLDDLLAGINDSDRVAMQRGIGETDSLLQGVALAQADVGTYMKVVELQGNVVNDTIMNLKTTLSNIEDLDYASAITQMNKQMLALEAAQSSFAKISQLSLFNYIK